MVDWGGYMFTASTPSIARLSPGAEVYIFAKLTMDWSANRTWEALYVGQTDSFIERLSNHERWQETERAGANQIHVHREGHALIRHNVEINLIQQFDPLLNRT